MFKNLKKFDTWAKNKKYYSYFYDNSIKENINITDHLKRYPYWKCGFLILFYDV